MDKTFLSWGRGELGARRGGGGAHLGFAVGGVLCVHAGVEGDAVEAGRLWEGGEGAGEAGECDEAVVAERGHGGLGERREGEGYL